jgi:hypothetical protein
MRGTGHPPAPRRWPAWARGHWRADASSDAPEPRNGLGPALHHIEIVFDQPRQIRLPINNDEIVDDCQRFRAWCRDVPDNGPDAWDVLRASRCDPPGAAWQLEHRRRTYVFALEQAEQMFRAAVGVGTATRPLLVF